MIEPSDALIALGGSFSGFLAAALYTLYQNKNGTVSQIRAAEVVKLGHELEEQLKYKRSHRIPYASVEGVVGHAGKTFTTNKSQQTGVILHRSIIEHKSKRTQGYWAEVKQVLHDSLDAAPFVLRGRDDPTHTIWVTEATEAENLLDELEVTHNEFSPSSSSLVKAGIERLFGEVCRGMQEREEMLVVGTSLMGIGEIFMEDGRIKLRPPQTGGAKYILTKLTRNQLLKQLQSEGSTLKVLAYIFGAVASGMIGFAVWRIVKRFYERRKADREFDEIRQETLRRRSQAREAHGECKMDDSCVVCLSNPREVVTLNCGHIAMCADCAQLLPQPPVCPVCRLMVEKFLPIYHP